MGDGGFRSGISAAYWLTTGLMLLCGGIFIAVRINPAGLLLALMGLGAFWLAVAHGAACEEMLD